MINFEVEPAIQREMMEHFRDAVPAVFDVPTLLIALGMLQLALKHPLFAVEDPNPNAPANVTQRIINTFLQQLRDTGMPLTATFYEAAGKEEQPRWTQ